MNIILADEQVITRAGLKTILASYKKTDTIVSSFNFSNLEKQLENNTFDLVVIGLHPLSSFTFEVVQKIQHTYSSMKIIIISSDSSNEEINSLMELKVSGFLTRECNEDEINRAMNAIQKNERFYCQKIVNTMLDSRFEQKEPKQSISPLSEREQEVTKLIAEGLTNKQVAEKLFISSHTVHTHRKNIMKKLKVNSANGIVKYAINNGLVKI